MKLNRLMRHNIRPLLVFIISFLYLSYFCINTYGQRYIYGVVVDSITGVPIPDVNIYTKNTKKNIRSDSEGRFKIPVSGNISISVKSMGYKEMSKMLSSDSSDTVYFRMSEDATTLNEVVVKHKRAKYSKKNNPAVDLIQRVRKDREASDPTKSDYYSYEKYEKTLLGTNDFAFDSKNQSRLPKRFRFMESLVDTALWTGKRMIDLALLEKTSYKLIRENPKINKEIITGLRDKGINEMFEQENIRTMLEDVLREIDIYDNDINLMQNRFVSPLSHIGADFYMYHITDTVHFGGMDCVEVSFAPKTPETFGFNGHLYIPSNDSVKYIKRVSMRVPKAINVNYVDNIFVSQNYEKDSIGNVHKVLDDISLELSIFKSLPPILASRQTRYRDFSYKERENMQEYYSMLGNYFEADGIESVTDEYWEKKRTIPFSHAEKKLSDLVENIRKIKFLYWAEKIIKPIFQGYVGTSPVNSKFNLGPVNTFVSYNDPEGLRLKIGGMSTSSLSDKFFFRGYGAYGVRDHKWKYMGEFEYSFIKKKNHSREFPMNAIRATLKYDTDPIGVRYLYTNPDNVILSIKRKKNDLIIYQRSAKIEYNLELRNNLSFNLGYRNELSESTDWVAFKNGYGENYDKYRIGTFFATIRYAPGEKFVQGTSNRLPVNMDAPIVSLTHEYGPKRMLGSDFVMNKTEISFLKRFWFSAFGYTNILIKGGKIWSQVPYPSLLWQNSNLSYTIQQESFALLNPMEFAIDQYASWDMEYFINGAIFNRIPIIKKAKLREILSFKGFFGNLSKKNNPEYNKNLYSFPQESHTSLMGSKPYMEVGVGIDNIFTILRLDYVWRLTYKNNPDIDKRGIRVSLHLSF